MGCIEASQYDNSHLDVEFAAVTKLVRLDTAAIAAVKRLRDMKSNIFSSTLYFPWSREEIEGFEGKREVKDSQLVTLFTSSDRL